MISSSKGLAKLSETDDHNYSSFHQNISEKISMLATDRSKEYGQVDNDCTYRTPCLMPVSIFVQLYQNFQVSYVTPPNQT